MKLLPPMHPKAVDKNPQYFVVVLKDVKGEWQIVESQQTREKALHDCMILQQHFDKHYKGQYPTRWFYSVCSADGFVQNNQTKEWELTCV